MSLVSGFVKFCTSGLGTGTDAGKAVGYTILILCGVFILAYWVIKGIVKLVKYFTSKKEATPPPTGTAQ